MNKPLNIKPLPPELQGAFEEVKMKPQKPAKEEREAKWYVDIIEKVARAAWFMINEPQDEAAHRRELVKALRNWDNKLGRKHGPRGDDRWTEST